MTQSEPFILAGKRTSSREIDQVMDKWTGRKAGAVCVPRPTHIERAIQAGLKAERPFRDLPAHARAEALRRLEESIEKDRHTFVRLLIAEAGKTIRDAMAEVDRSLLTCRIAAEEATRINGEYLPLDLSMRSEGAAALVKRVPVGLCSFITPFNFPLNLVMHKIAPAIACGCPFILKPAPQAPMTALRLGKLLLRCGLPAGAFSILPARIEDAALLVRDDRIKLLSFTGSAEVGWLLKSQASRKKVVLELGGNAACIVDQGVDIKRVAERITFGAFSQAGQSCISVQRVLAHASDYEKLRRSLVRHSKSLVFGDPRDTTTDLSPLISRKDADRVLRWIAEARQAGAGVLCGGRRATVTGKRGNARVDAFILPTIVENVPRSSRLWKEEVFGPVFTLHSFEDFDAAIALANDSRFGLQAGVFTNDLAHAMQAWEQLHVGGVVINDVPSFRVDSMPYGGIKDSGLGREGVRSAILEMTEPRIMIMR